MIEVAAHFAFNHQCGGLERFSTDVLTESLTCTYVLSKGVLYK